MRITIHTRRHGVLSFWCPDGPRGGYVRLEGPGKTGTLGHQICAGGGMSGETLSATPMSLERVARAWWKKARPRWNEEFLTEA